MPALSRAPANSAAAALFVQVFIMVSFGEGKSICPCQRVFGNELKTIGTRSMGHRSSVPNCMRASWIVDVEALRTGARSAWRASAEHRRRTHRTAPCS